MQSILILSSNEEKRQEEALRISTELAVHTFDRHLIVKEDDESTEESFGIALVRNIKKKAMLKPMYGKIQAILFLHAERLTLPAQNALLKLLEEPPDQTIIILAATSEGTLLETIISRCKIIKLHGDKPAINDPKSVLPNVVPINEALVLSETLAKSDAKEWMKLILVEEHKNLLHLIMIGKYDPSIFSVGKRLKKITSFYRLLSTTNVAPRLVVEEFLLNG